MAITSVGYDGTVNESQWSDMIKKIGSSEYGVVDTGDWKVTAVSGADRTVSIAAGKGWGHGVFNENTANVTVQLDTVSSGSRWDLVAMRRDWTGVGGVSTFVKVNGTSAKEIPVGRAKGAGVIDEQPLALVQITAGQTQPTAIVDLRCWSGNGGLFANDELALTYLDSAGSQVHVAGRLWHRIIGTGGSPAWTTTSSSGAIPIFGPSSSLDGGVAPAGGSYLIQAGSNVGASDSIGFGRIIFPKPFPNGLLTVILTNGDSSVDRAQGHVITLTPAGAPYGAGSRTEVKYSVAVEDSAEVHRERRQGGLTHRVNWIAIGW
jgi:hypothetical protein